MATIGDNPYSIDQPAEALFYGRQLQVERLVASFSAPIAGSFALIGGRRFGKTSLLHAVELGLWAASSYSRDNAYRIIPVYINLLGEDIRGWSDLFPLVGDILTEQVTEHCPDILPENWNAPSAIDSTRPAHRVFSDRLLKLCRNAARSGNPVRVLLLLDEAEEILDKPWRTELFNKLRWLTYEEESTRSYLKIILAGSSGFYNDVQQPDRSSPLWGVVAFEFLAAFSEEETLRLIQEPCEGKVPREVAQEIVQHSGGHPYIVQYLMHHLWNKGLSGLSLRDVRELTQRFQRERWSQLQGWRKSIGHLGCQAYSILSSNAGWMEEDAIRREIRGPAPELLPALTALCYHGWAIHDDDWRYRAVGTLVRDWLAVSGDGAFSNHHLTQQSLELSGRYDQLSARMAALDKDIGREMDNERRLVLEQRRQDLANERNQVATQLSGIEQSLKGNEATAR